MIETEYTTHQRIKPSDKEYLKDTCKENGFKNPASFLHYIIQFYKAKQK